MGRQVWPKVGDRVEVANYHRFGGTEGVVVAVGDNVKAQTNQIHVHFDRDTWGAIKWRELWFNYGELFIIETAEQVAEKSGKTVENVREEATAKKLIDNVGA